MRRDGSEPLGAVRTIHRITSPSDNEPDGNLQVDLALRIRGAAELQVTIRDGIGERRVTKKPGQVLRRDKSSVVLHAQYECGLAAAPGDKLRFVRRSLSDALPEPVLRAV